MGGESDAPPDGAPKLLKSPFTIGLIWVGLLLLIYAFSGQSSKFIYIDF